MLRALNQELSPLTHRIPCRHRRPAGPQSAAERVPGSGKLQQSHVKVEHHVGRHRLCRCPRGAAREQVRLRYRVRVRAYNEFWRVPRPRNALEVCLPEGKRCCAVLHNLIQCIWCEQFRHPLCRYCVCSLSLNRGPEAVCEAAAAGDSNESLPSISCSTVFLSAAD